MGKKLINEALYIKAKKLAEQHYITQVVLDETTDGNPIFLAVSPEIEGCIAQGDTVDEAIANLRDARVDFFYSLLEDKLPVPQPISLSVQTTSPLTLTITNSVQVENQNTNIKMDVYSFV